MTPERWRHIEQLYHAALERDARQRDGFLAEACADDDALRREVEVLLAANERAGGFLDSPAFELEARSMAREAASVSLGVQVGQEVSHYRILMRLGAGGMGEVFLAHDHILERRVALKLLPVRFSADVERLQRFIREAKAASALNHPNIITIYEIGEIDTALGKTAFIAAEFIEGETLRTWVTDAERRLPGALEIATQVASALDAAHKAGIVHRDIKPENVMVRPDGLVKVLDFGLAKLTAPPADRNDSDGARSVKAVKTQPGMILGTLRYMSPEQARGRGVDARSDIFSLGVVLYELLTGEPLFAGDTDADVVAAILHQDVPPLDQQLSDVPAELERIVQKALAKDKEQRYQNARDLQIDLQSLKQESEMRARLARSGARVTSRQASQTSSAMTAPRFSLRQVLTGLTVALLLTAAIWWLVMRRSGQVATPPPESLKTVEVVTWQSAPGEVYSIGAFSPDGKWVAFTSTEGGSKNIWIKQAASGDAKPSTEDDYDNANPIWSPEGDELAFTSLRSGQWGIWRKPPLGGTPSLLKTLALGEGSVRLRRWSKKSTTIYYESMQNLFALEINSGQTRQVTNLDPTKVKPQTINISPDEQHIAYIASNDDGSDSIWVVPRQGGAAKQIAGLLSEARNTVWHADSRRLFFSANVDGTFQIFVTDLAGHQPAQITKGDRDSLVLDASTDGTRVLYGSSKEDSDLWGVNVATSNEFPVASDIGFELWPDVSPDSQRVAYQAVMNLSQGNKLDNSAVLTKPVRGEAKPFLLAQDGSLLKWSPDGKRLAFLRPANDAYALWTVNAVGGEEKQLTTGELPQVSYLALPYQRCEISNFSWSPDGQRLVYVSKNNDPQNLWAVDANGTGHVQITSNNDANLWLYCPLWSADGGRIAYSARTNRVANGEKVTYSLWVADLKTKASKLVFQASSFLRLVGWSPTEKELIIVTFNKKGQIVNGQTTDVALLRVPVPTGETSLIAVLPATYFYNIYLSADRRAIAFTSHQGSKDDLWLVPTTGGRPRQLTANNDSRLYFSSLAWSPDGRAIYYGKQIRYSMLSMISNFE
jgi:eukaryotic-like serine/threonine-protein kinase